MSRCSLACISIAAALWVSVVAWAWWTAPTDGYNSVDDALNLAQYVTDIAPPISDGQLQFPAKETFFQLTGRKRSEYLAALSDVSKHWQPGNIALLLKTGRLYHGGLPRGFAELLEQKTGQDFGRDSHKWYDYLWQQPYEPHPQLASIMAAHYSQIDPRFAEYFDDDYPATIRLDEILWGGVVRDGIPPLKNPRMLAAAEADYLEDSNIVFGIAINGDARAYPKRVLAWHEMFKDTVGDVSINGVYCTLCGSMIVYETVFNEKHYELGTSGFLYRSNKLMYDHETKSMWSTLTGEPVVGELVGQGIKLKRLHVVTTTWGEWKRRHPETTVLSLTTGHSRNYGEGVAYRDYFSTDRLMFRVPFHDERLKNKQEVVALRFDQTPEQQLAIDTDYLLENPIYHDQVSEQRLVVLTDASGANRVYDPGEVRFVGWDQDRLATDEHGNVWRVTEAGLVNEQSQVLPRLPAHRAFWFGWHAAYPKTRLVSN